MSQFFLSSFVIFVNKCIYQPVLLIIFIGLSIHTNSYAQWQKATSNTTQTLLQVNYGGGLWVAVGDNGTIVTSPDRINWTPRISTTTANLQDVYFDGGLWVAVGGNGSVNAIVTSSDGITWTSRAVDQLSALGLALAGISHSGGKWVANTHYNNQVLTSTDGVNWTVQWLSVRYTDLRCGNGKWVAALGASIWTSSDEGLTWISTYSQRRGVFYYVSFSNGEFSVNGDYGIIQISSDGTNWQGGAGISYSGARKVCYGDGVWIASFTVEQLLYTSRDGIRWQYSYPSKRDFTSVAYHESEWVFVGFGGTIEYNTDSALPVSLISFQGQTNGSNAHLTWETAWEKGASHFLVERSQDATSFEAIGRVNAQGTTTTNQYYTFLDKDLASGLWYYRLRQVDLGGAFTHSQIIAVRIGTEPLDGLTLSPNPGSGQLVVESKAGINAVHIYSITGKLVHQQLFEQANSQWIWDGTAQSAGTYIIRVQTQDGKLRLVRWIKQ